VFCLQCAGEEDPELRRGRPLRLDGERYALLRQAVLCGAADHDTRVLAQSTRLQAAML
jgi:hypothetical protein